jgi:hypothetical protein
VERGDLLGNRCGVFSIGSARKFSERWLLDEWRSEEVVPVIGGYFSTVDAHIGKISLLILVYADAVAARLGGAGAGYNRSFVRE